MLYTSVQEYKKKLYYRGYRDDGTREQYVVGSRDDPYTDLVNNYYHFKVSDKERMRLAYERILQLRKASDFTKKIYSLPSLSKSSYHTLADERVFEMGFHYKDTRNIKNVIMLEFPEVKIYSDIDFKYKYIRARNAFDTLKHTIKIAYLDIETETEEGFAKPENPTERVNCISMRIQDGKMYVWALGEATLDKDDIVLKCFTDERELLKDFVKTWRELDFDIISGWNINHFDLPYLYNRMLRTIGETFANKLSPFDVVVQKLDKNNFTFAATEAAVDIIGIQILDYLDVYKKHTYENRENYKLNTIVRKKDQKKLNNLYDINHIFLYHLILILIPNTKILLVILLTVVVVWDILEDKEK